MAVGGRTPSTVAARGRGRATKGPPVGRISDQKISNTISNTIRNTLSNTTSNATSNTRSYTITLGKP